MVVGGLAKAHLALLGGSCEHRLCFLLAVITLRCDVSSGGSSEPGVCEGGAWGLEQECTASAPAWSLAKKRDAVRLGRSSRHWVLGSSLPVGSFYLFQKWLSGTTPSRS